MSGIIVIGAGPGIGRSVARRFAREGMPVGVIARSRNTVDATVAAVVASGVPAQGTTADVADESALRSALDELIGDAEGNGMGVPDVLVYNAAIIQWDAVGALTAAQHLDAWAVNVVGAITAAAHVLPAMAEVGAGTYLLTGGMPTPIPEVTSLSLGKAGLRALAELLDAQFRPAGVHVATVTVAGAVAPGTAFDPDDIAECYWQLHTQPVEEWEHQVVFAGTPVPGRRAAV